MFLTGFQLAGRSMLTEPVANGYAPLLVSSSANGSLSAFWQILAVLAVGGIVLVAILAIIEPGPLVKRRPFPRKERSRPSESKGGRQASLDQPAMEAGAEANLDGKKCE